MLITWTTKFVVRTQHEKLALSALMWNVADPNLGPETGYPHFYRDFTQSLYVSVE
jgi:hypothetical protein